MIFKMTSSCCTIVDRKDHVQYLQFQSAIPDDCTLSLTKKNIANLILFKGENFYFQII